MVKRACGIAAGLFVYTLPLSSFAQTDAAAPQAALTTPPPPPPPPPPQVTVHTEVAPTPSAPKSPLVDFISLRVMHDKGLITDAEYRSAMADIGASVGEERAGESVNLVISKWSATLYGFVEGDFILDSTQSFNDLAGNALVQRPLTYSSPQNDLTCATPPCPTPQPGGPPVSYYGGSNARTQFSVRNTRFGLRLRAPEIAKVRASGTLEMDFLGFDQPSTEAALFNNPTFRIRLAYLKVETPIVDLLVGQYWHMFGWQPFFFPNTTQIQGLPGELYERTPQLRISHRFAFGGTSLELAAAALRPPTKDGGVPDFAGGIRFAFDRWRGTQTTGATSTGISPASIAITGDFRDFWLPEFQQYPQKTVKISTGAFAVDAFIPIIPSSHQRRGNTLSVSGELAYGGGIADMYTSLTGGVTFPTIVNNSGLANNAPWPGTVDNGMVVYDNAPGPKNASCPDGQGFLGATSCHDLHTIVWLTGIAGLQYYFPGGRVWVSGNYAHTESPNIQDFTQTAVPNPNISSYAQAAVVRKSEDWFDANVFVEPLPSVRFGFEYACFIDHYVDGVQATNHRGQVSGFFLF